MKSAVKFLKSSFNILLTQEQLEEIERMRKRTLNENRILKDRFTILYNGNPRSFDVSVQPITRDYVSISFFECEDELQRIEKIFSRLSIMKGLNNEDIGVLQCVESKNLQGIRPSHKDVQRDRKVAKQTNETRIFKLVQLGLIEEGKSGREKNLIITKSGRELLNDIKPPISSQF